MSSSAQVPVIPPAERTIGQLVADTLRFYGNRFWACLALGIGPAIFTVVVAQLSRDGRITALVAVWPLVMTASYVAACFLVSGTPLSAPRATTAALLGLVIAIPVPLLVTILILPSVLWLALVGMAVPAAVIEGSGLRESVRRGLALARADYVHAAGTLATLVLLVVLTHLVLFQALHGLSHSAAIVAAFLASVVISPLLFIGSAQLYYDQKARAEVQSKAQRTKEA
jgi:small-conductance mechanosensitive channel